MFPMVAVLTRLRKNALVKSSFILMVGSGAASVFNYLYHLLMGRMLGPADYGVLSALISMLYIISVPTNTIMTVVTKYTSEYKAFGRVDQMHRLFRKLTKQLFFLGCLAFLVTIFLSQPISNFLHLESNSLVILTGSLFIPALLVPISRGLLRGLQKFTAFTISQFVEFGIKLAVSVTLVMMGYQVFGAMFGILVGFLLGYLFTFYPIRGVLRTQEGESTIDLGSILRYAFPVFIATLCLTLFYSLDVVLVKHFFDAHDAGLYSAVSLLGRAIFFATLVIPIAMFSIVSEKEAKKEPHQYLFYQSVALVSVVGVVAISVYFLFPEFVLHLLFGSEYLSIAPLLGIFAVLMTLFSLNNVMVNYFLSVGRRHFVWLLLAAVIAQIILVSLFHNNLGQVVWVLTMINFLLLLGLMGVQFLTRESPTL